MMRKREQGTREYTKTTPEEKIAALRRIVEACAYAKIDGVMVDLFSASAIVKVYDALNETNKARFLSLPVQKMAHVAFQLVKQGNTMTTHTKFCSGNGDCDCAEYAPDTNESLRIDKYEVVYDCHCNASYRGHSIMRDDDANCWHVYEAGDKDAIMLWTGDSVEACKATIDEVLEDIDESEVAL